MALWRTRSTRPQPQLPKPLLQTLTPKSDLCEIPVSFLADLRHFLLIKSVICTVESVFLVNRSRAYSIQPDGAKVRACGWECWFICQKSKGQKADRRFLVPTRMNFKRRKKISCSWGWIYSSAPDGLLSARVVAGPVGAASLLLFGSVWSEIFKSLAWWPAGECDVSVRAASPSPVGFVWSADHLLGFSCLDHLGASPPECTYVTSTVTARLLQQLILPLIMPNRSTPFMKSLDLYNCKLSFFYCTNPIMKDLEKKICVDDGFISTQHTPRKGLITTMGADLSVPHKTKSRKGSQPCSDGSPPEGFQYTIDAVMEKTRGKDRKKSRRRTIDKEKLCALQVFKAGVKSLTMAPSSRDKEIKPMGKVSFVPHPNTSRKGKNQVQLGSSIPMAENSKEATVEEKRRKKEKCKPRFC